MSDRVVDITESIMNGEFKVDPEEITNSYTHSKDESEFREISKSLDVIHEEHPVTEESEAEREKTVFESTSKVPVMSREHNTHIYYPSIVDFTDADEIGRQEKIGFAEDMDCQEKPVWQQFLSKTVISQLEHNDAAMEIISHMKPEQLTPEIINKLIKVK